MSDPLSVFEHFARNAKNFGTRSASGTEARDVHPFDERNIHPEISAVSLKLFDNGHYSQATFEAFKLLDQKVKATSGISDTGFSLMMAAFNEKSPKIKLTDLSTMSEIDEQLGFRFVFAARCPRFATRVAMTSSQTRSICASITCRSPRSCCAPSTIARRLPSVNDCPPWNPSMPNPWDIPYAPKFKIRDTDGSAIYTAVGRALSKWEGLVADLTFVFAVLTSQDEPWHHNPAVRAFGSVQSAAAKSEMVQHAADALFFNFERQLSVDCSEYRVDLRTAAARVQRLDRAAK